MQHALSRVSPTLDTDARTAWMALMRLTGPGERLAAALALLLTPDSEQELRAWELAVRGEPTARALLERCRRLPASARLPALERLLQACARDDTLEQRQSLMLAARRVMCADGSVSALDRLVWLAVRHLLSGPVRLHRGGLREDNDLTQLPLAMRQAIASVTAYLARLVPEPPRRERIDASGTAWHDRVVLAVWGEASMPPTCQVPDVDRFGRALQTLEGLGWVHRPLLARLWVDAADTRPGLRTRLDEPLPPAAEALRLACVLLDAPLPPALAAHFIRDPEQERRADGT